MTDFHVRRTTIEFRDQRAIAHAIALQSAGGEGFRVPLFRAAADGALSIAMAFNGSVVPSRVLKQRSPTVVLLPDDHPAAAGPAVWPQARRLARWASIVAVHATGGRAEHYAMFAQNAVHHGRLLVVEVELRHLDAWRDLMLLERGPGEVLCLVPSPGGQHPVSPAHAGELVH